MTTAPMTDDQETEVAELLARLHSFGVSYSTIALAVLDVRQAEGQR